MPQPYGYAIFDMPPNSDFSSFDTLNDCLPGNCISLFESRFIQTKKSRVRTSGFWTFGPSGETRTRGILLPKQARYQLRYTRIFTIKN